MDDGGGAERTCLLQNLLLSSSLSPTPIIHAPGNPPLQTDCYHPPPPHPCVYGWGGGGGGGGVKCYMHVILCMYNNTHKLTNLVVGSLTAMTVKYALTLEI